MGGDGVEDLNKGQKLVRIVELASRPGGVRVEDLMSRFGLDDRTFRRYLADLRHLDIPIEDEGRGARRVLRLSERYQRSRVVLSLAEVLSLHFGRTLFSFLQGTSFAKDLDDALERLAPMIARTHDDVRHDLDQLFVAVPEPRKDYRGEVASEIIDEVLTAVVFAQPIDARYRKGSLVLKRYRLEPLTVAVYRQALYLLARDSGDGAIKTFSVDRFEEVVRDRRESFERPEGWSPEEHLRHAFGIVSGPPEVVRLRFPAELKTYVKDRIWHHTQRFESEPDGAVVLRLEVAMTAELIQWVRGFGAQVEVVEPASLREEILEDARRMVAAAEAS